MRVRTPSDLSSLVRGRRRELGWSQSELAQRAGASYRWIVNLEAGKASVHMDMVLAALAALGLALDASVVSDDSGRWLDAYLEEFSGAD
jgi:HTH-type transcriptional regulator / antitoxin HipB